MKPRETSSVLASAGAALRRIAGAPAAAGPTGDDASPEHYQCEFERSEAQRVLEAVDPWRKGFTRRRLMQGGAMVLAAPLAQQLVTTRLAFAQTPGTATGNVAVVINCRGGYAGHNFVVPHGFTQYYDQMGNLAVPRNQLWGADSMFGWNPAFESWRPFWEQGRAAAVHAVALERPNYSHFGATEEQERGSIRNVGSGHLNRALEALGLVSTNALPFQAMQIGNNVPYSLQGPAPALALSSGVESFRLNAGNPQGLSSALAALYGAARPEDTAVRTTLDALQTAGQIAAEDYVPAVEYPEYGFANALREVARVIKAGVGLRIACVDIGGWDTHTDMGNGGDANANFNSHARELAEPIAAFATDLGALLDTTTIVTWTEFGRRPYRNDSNGTDHGNGNAMLLLGGGVQGGRYYANWSQYASEEVDGNIPKGTDTRDVWGGVYRRLGIGDPNVVFGDPNFRYTDLGVMSGG